MKAMIQTNETLSCTNLPVFVEKPVTPRRADTESIRLLTEQKLAEHLMICRRQLYNWRMAGLIPYLKLGKAVRFRPTDVQAALEKFTVNPIR
ncbi:MAG: helix-turn-helix domain-containing protein [Verrucomicrobiales bacterium]